MKLGKFTITHALTENKEQFASLTDFIGKNIIILERIVIRDTDGKQAVLMIGTSDSFDGIPDRANKIPEYIFEFEKSLILSDAADYNCKPIRKK